MSTACPFPQLIGHSIDGKELGHTNIHGIGSLFWDSELGEFVCMADVFGRLCFVQVRVTLTKLEKPK